ncbi:MAG: hemerythrin domain-containing protein, partial [Bacteroidales bacterium]
TDTVLAELNNIGKVASSAGIDFQSWPLDLLADYIEKTHHRYVQDKSLEIIQYLTKICEVHGTNHPELFKIKKLFTKVIENLAMHMQKEELVLFPFIRKMEKTLRSGQFLEKPSFGSIKNPIETMEDEHLAEGDRYREIDNLSNHYTIPKDGCNTYQVTYTMLKEFEEDLHMHIHLENNILFPKAILLEERLM